MAKAIEASQEYLIVCDNPKCDYKIPNNTGDVHVDMKDYINRPCPQCGENLLTQDDYEMYEKMIKAVDAINDLFGDVEDDDEERKMVSVHGHNGQYKIIEHDTQGMGETQEAQVPE